MLVAGILETMTRNEDAIAIYRQIDQKSPFHWSARIRVAVNLEALDRDDDAINLLRVLTKKTKGRTGQPRRSAAVQQTVR